MKCVLLKFLVLFIISKYLDTLYIGLHLYTCLGFYKYRDGFTTKSLSQHLGEAISILKESLLFQGVDGNL